MLGNIPANTKLKVEMTFISLLKRQFADHRNTVTLAIPTYIARRYGTAPTEFRDATSTRIAQGLSIQIEVIELENVREISSETHKIVVERGLGKKVVETWADLAGKGPTSNVHTALVKLDVGSTFLDRDFVLDIETKPRNGVEEPQAWLEVHPSLENHKAMMLIIPPSFMVEENDGADNGEIIFLADRSGSMDDKLASLKLAMAFFLKGISPGRKFNIWCFGTSYTSLWPKSVEYSRDSLQEALNYVSYNFNADMGGTELLPALGAIVKAREPSHPTDVIVLTDGDVWRLEQTLALVQRTRTYSKGLVRFFALGVGNAVSHALVEGIAKCGGGYSEVIPAVSQGGWEDRVIAMLKAASTKHIGPLGVESDKGSQPADDSSRRSIPLDILQSPADLSYLNPFQANRVFMLFDAGTNLDAIILRVTTLTGSEIRMKLPVKTLQRRDSIIHKLTARAVLEDLERGQGQIHVSPTRPPPGSQEERKLVQSEAEAIGCKWSLASKWTSFFLQEESYDLQSDGCLIDEIIQIDDAIDDPDLLRPRGMQRNLLTDLSHSELGQSIPSQSHSQSNALVNRPPNGRPMAANSNSDNHASHSDLRKWLGESPWEEPYHGQESTRPSSNPNAPSSNTRGSGNLLGKMGGVCTQGVLPSALTYNTILPTESTRSQGSPINNLSVNCAPRRPITPKGEDGDSKKQFIRELLSFQQYDGSFLFDTYGELEKLLGASFISIVTGLQGMDWWHPIINERKLLAYTFSILVLLEREFQSCKALWELMWRKALSYTEDKIPSKTTRDQIF